MAYIFEPYNAYQKPPRKKHWMEIAEEEALLHRIDLEEQSRQKELFHEALKQHLALREANAKQNPSNLNNQNVALTQYAPQPASQQVQDGQYAAPAGGGGWVLPQLLEEQAEPTEKASFTALPASGIGPLRVYFTNTSPTPANDTFFWDFGSGSLTSNIASPGSRLYTQTGSYTITLQETSSAGNMTTASKTITVTAPVLTPLFTANPVISVAPYTSSFTNTSTVLASVGDTYSYNWVFGDGVTTTIFSPTHVYGTGSFPVRLDISESVYGLRASYILPGGITGSLPTITPSFTITFNPPTLVAPATATFANYTTTTAVGGYIGLTYLWDLGSGSVYSVANTPSDFYYLTAKGYTASLQATESHYPSITASVSLTWSLT